METDISRVVRRLYLLIGLGTMGCMLLLATVVPIIMDYSAQEAASSWKLYGLLFVPVEVGLLGWLYVYLRPIARLAALQPTGRPVPAELAQQARTLAFKIPIYFLIVPELAAFIGVVCAQVIGVLFEPGYSLPRHYPGAMFAVILAATAALAVSIVARRILRPVLFFTAGLAENRGPRFNIQSRQMITMLLTSFIPIAFLVLVGFNLAVDGARNIVKERYTVLARTIANYEAVRMNDPELIAFVESFPLPEGYAFLLDGQGRPLTEVPAPHRHLLIEDGGVTWESVRFPVPRGKGQWTLGFVYRLDPLRDPTVKRSVAVLIVFALGALGFVFLVARYVADDVARDLHYVTGRLSELARGEGVLLDRLKVLSLDEIGDLVLAFNEIQKKVWEQQRQMVREQKELLAVQQTSQKISSILDGELMLHEIVSQVEATFGYRNTSIFLVDEAAQEIYPAAWSDSSPEAGHCRRFKIGMEGVMGRVAATGTALLVGNVNEFPGYISSDSEIRSELAVPIIFNNRTLGVFNVESRELNAFGERDLQILTTLANQAGVALHNARAYRELEGRRQEAAILAQVAQIVNSTLDLEEVLSLALAQLRLLVGYDSAAILLAEDNEMVFAACAGFKNPEELKKQRIRPDEANLGYRVMLSQQTRVVSDVQALADWGHDRHDLEGAHTIRSWIGAPLVFRGHSIGLLTLDGYRPDQYREEEGVKVTAFASQIAVAVQNARLYQTVLSNAQDLTLLYEVSQQIAGLLQVETLLNEVVARVQAAFGYEVVSIHLIEPGGTLRVAAYRGIDAALLKTEQALGDEVGIVPWVAATGQLQLVRDVTQEPRYVSTGGELRSELAIPLSSSGIVIGVFNLESRHLDAFTPEDVRLMTALAHQLAAALENAHLFERVRSQAARLELLQQVSRQISSILSIEELLNEVMYAVTMAFGYRYIAILLLDESTDELYVGALQGYTPEIAERRLPLTKGGVAAVAALSRAPVYVPDVERDPRYIRGAPSVRCELAIPLLTGSRVIGVFNLESEERNAFNQDDIALMTALSHQITVALENARLFESARSQALELARMAGNLVDEKSKLDAILRNIADGLIVTDPQGGVLRVNPAFEQMFEIPAAKIVGGKLIEVVPERQLHRLITGVLLEESKGGATTEIALADGRTLKASALAIQEDRPIGVVTVLRDVTHEKEVDRMKTEFISTVSHELRTPLTSVLGFAKLISKTFERDVVSAVRADDRRGTQAIRRIRENLDIIVIEGERLTRLINDVLDISKMEAGKVEWHDQPFDLGELVTQTVEGVQGLILEKQLALEVDVRGPFAPLTADPDRVQQIMLNLLSNAMKFTERGKVRLSARPLAEGEVVHGWKTPPVGGVLVSVHDSGMGIPAEALPRLFQRFQQIGDTLRDKPKGTGLGLAICREIINHYGGAIWAESEVGRGSVFSFVLPLVRLLPELEAVLPHPVAPVFREPRRRTGPLTTVPHGPFRLLIVDDEDHIRSLLVQELVQAGYQILEARNGAEALGLARSERPSLILLDVMLPDISGFDVTRILKADPETCAIPILILSIIEDRQRGLAMGANAYLTKPVETDRLLAVVAKLLGGDAEVLQVTVDGDGQDLDALLSVLRGQGVEVTEARDWGEILSLVRSEHSEGGLLEPGILKVLRFQDATRACAVILLAGGALSRSAFSRS